MKNSKKYVYPLLFSLCFFLIFCFLILVLNALILPGGDETIFKIVSIALLVWVLGVSPIYSVLYSKFIKKEKNKFLFATYNSFVVTIFMILPFMVFENTVLYIACYFFWLEA